MTAEKNPYPPKTLLHAGWQMQRDLERFRDEMAKAAAPVIAAVSRFGRRFDSIRDSAGNDIASDEEPPIRDFAGERAWPAWAPEKGSDAERRLEGIDHQDPM